MKISAVIPTRGDCHIGTIVDWLRQYSEIDEIKLMIGDTPFNRYLGMESAKNEIIYSQDDDCITDLRPLLEAYEPGVIVNAMTPQHAAQYPNRQTLIGFGALFHRDLLRCFSDYNWKRDALFYRESDRIFPTVNPHKTVFPWIEILPQAHHDNRLWKQPGHIAARREMDQRICEVTGIRA